MNHEELHQKIMANQDRLREWFKSKSQGLAFPIYTSFDIRDAGFKIGPVDANIFPAGFNNICLTDRETAHETAKEFLDDHYGPETKKILLLTEEHTSNPYYWDNVVALTSIFRGAGREVRLAIPRALEEPLQVMSASGAQLTVYTAQRDGQKVMAGDFEPDLIISNNDFSVEYDDWGRDLSTPMNPPRELGWYRRRKDRFFRVYNEMVEEFCKTIEVDPWTLQVETETFKAFDVDDEDSRESLALQVEKFFARLKVRYEKQGITREPFLFVKNNAGTYGLGVIQVKSADEIRGWNYKSRKKMKAAKGGREITEVIIQEGIPTTIHADGGQIAEPVMYMIGCQLAGGFLRVHGEKSDADSLNSPGAVFQKLCISDLDTKLTGCPMENTYGWVARLAFLSVAREAAELEVTFKNYKPGVPCA